MSGSVPGIRECLRGRRNDLGLTQEAVGARVGLSATMIGHIEAGRAPVPRARVKRMAAALALPEATVQRAASLPPREIDAGTPGGALRAVRLRFGLTLEQMAARAGMAISWLSSIERGNRRIRPATARTLARAYGVSPTLLAPILEDRGAYRDMARARAEEQVERVAASDDLDDLLRAAAPSTLDAHTTRWMATDTAPCITAVWARHAANDETGGRQ